MRYAKLIIAVIATALLAGIPTTYAQDTSIDSVTVSFCNNAGVTSNAQAITMNAEANQPREICISLDNPSDRSVTITLDFVDGTITAGDQQQKACQSEGDNEAFGQFVDIDQTIFTLAPNSFQQTTATLTFPRGFAGMNYGCLTAQITASELEQREGGQPFIQQENFIDVLVEGDIELGVAVIEQSLPNGFTNLSDSNEIVVYKDPQTGLAVAKVGFKNTGNIPQEVTVEGALIDVIGKQALPATTKKVLPNQVATFTFPLASYIPVYEGLMDINLHVSHQPVFAFQTSNITDEMRQPKEFTLGTSFVLVPWNVIFIILAVLVLLWLLTRRDRSVPKHKRLSPRPKPTPVKSKKQKDSQKKRSKTTTNKSQKDDLTKIEGIGPKTQEVLYNAGITTYQQLSTTKVATLRKIMDKAGSAYSNFDANEWKKQATRAKHGKRDELKKMQS